MADAASPVKPDFTTQSPAVYKANIDAGFEVLDRIAWMFACYEKATPDMQVRLYPGSVHYENTLVELAEQNTGTITAPSGNPRIDRVYVDHQTGVVGVITGSEAASPTAPALSPGMIPIAQILLDNSPATTTITNSLITDERNLFKTDFTKGWIQFNGSGTIAIKDSFNVDSITDDGTGKYTVTWDTDFANVNYCIIPGCANQGDQTLRLPGILVAPLVGSVEIRTFDTSFVITDSDYIRLIAMGEQ